MEAHAYQNRFAHGLNPASYCQGAGAESFPGSGQGRSLTALQDLILDRAQAGGSRNQKQEIERKPGNEPGDKNVNIYKN